MYKTLLLKYPWLYAIVQSIRDIFLHKKYLNRNSFAQHNEDVDLLRLLKRTDSKGPYVDIGSNHPFKISNTYLLYRNGWRGLCVDPLPRFINLYKKWRPEDKFLCVGISDTPGEMTLFEFEADVLSTFDEKLAKTYQGSGYKLRKTCSTKLETIDVILESAGLIAPISLLSIDIEGHELSALKSISLNKWKPSFIILEVVTADGSKNDSAIEYLIEHGYSISIDSGLNIIFQRIQSE